MMFGKCTYSTCTCGEYHDRKDLNREDRSEVVCSRLSEFIGIEDEAEQ